MFRIAPRFVFALLAAVGMYVALFDPISLRSAAAFRFVGAGIPSVLAAGAVYWVAMIVAARFRHEYRTRSWTERYQALEVGL